MRIPGGDVQPRVAVGGDGTVHMVFLRGEENSCDVFYTRSTDGEKCYTLNLRDYQSKHIDYVEIIDGRSN